MNKPFIQVLFQSLLSVVLLPGMIRAPQESEKEIIVSLARPAEGETFYAGPSSLLYNIPIHGSVESDLFPPEEIRIVLNILQNSEVVSTYETYPDSNGVYKIYATVNPNGSTEDFPATQADCSSYCHYLSDFVLPAGAMILEITATDPAGKQDSVERNITVDRSNFAQIPIKVTLDDLQHSERPLENIPVTAATHIYLWRSRHFMASTDVNGRANIQIEALAESPTRYWLQVEPSIVDGVLYYSVEPVEVVLPPGANSSNDQVELKISTKTGEIRGKVVGIDEDLSTSSEMLAIRQDNGFSYSAQISSQGDFVFEDIPLYDYLIVPDIGKDDLQNIFVPSAARANLIQKQIVSVEFSVVDMEGNTLAGEVKGEDGQLLPFAWVTNEKLPLSHPVMIDSSRIKLPGLPPQTLTFTVNAPGHYSRAYTLNFSSDPLPSVFPELIRQPGTRLIPWGSGEIVAPVDSLVEMHEDGIEFRRGWLWGQNQTPVEIRIFHETAEIVLTKGRFAFESLPNNKKWFYLFEGKAIIYPGGGRPPVNVDAGQMVVMLPDEPFVPIPIDQTVVSILRQGTEQSPLPVWEPTISARIRDSIARVGVGSVQLVTFITYGLILISIVGFPFVTLYLRISRRNRSDNEENDETKRRS